MYMKDKQSTQRGIIMYIAHLDNGEAGGRGCLVTGESSGLAIEVTGGTWGPLYRWSVAPLTSGGGG